MDWQIDRKWSCAAVGCGGFRWFAMICGTLGNEKSIGFTMVFAHGGVQNRIRPGFDPKVTQSDRKVTPKWPKVAPERPQSSPKLNKSVPKWPQSDPKLTPEFYKIIKIYWENECFLKINLNIPKGNTQWSKAISKWPKIIWIYLNWPQSGSQVTPNYLQNDPNVAPEARSYAKDGPKVAPKSTQRHPRVPKLPQSDAKVPPKSPSYAKSVL